MLRGEEIGSFISTGDDAKDATIAQDILALHGAGPATEAQAMYLQGAAFATAAQLLDVELTSKRNAFIAAPYVVNAAFALEVYLKSLYVALGVSAPGHHDLSKLLANVPADARTAIQIQIPKYWVGEAADENYDLSAIVDSMAGAFVGWRYYYEGKGGFMSVSPPRVMYALKVLHGASRAVVFGIV